jgi:hypothetical protein
MRFMPSLTNWTNSVLLDPPRRAGKFNGTSLRLKLRPCKFYRIFFLYLKFPPARNASQREARGKKIPNEQSRPKTGKEKLWLARHGYLSKTFAGKSNFSTKSSSAYDKMSVFLPCDLIG